MRNPEPVRQKLPKTIDREDFPPAYMSLITNAHEWGGSRIYSENFGVTSPDFAILSALSNNPGCQAVDVTQIVALDKSVVSRRLKRLHSMDLVTWEHEDTRRRLYLTQHGADIHDLVLPVALTRAERMTTGFSTEEKMLLKQFLRRIFENCEWMNSTDGLPLPANKIH